MQGLKQAVLQFNGGEVRVLAAKLKKEAHEIISSLYPKLGTRINSRGIMERGILGPPPALDIQFAAVSRLKNNSRGNRTRQLTPGFAAMSTRCKPGAIMRRKRRPRR